jgi:membrane-associated protease RseP (regulator of RpoE activity)
VQTTEASAGAALVNAEGKLLGVIAATPAQGQASGWSYAVPARHVGRLLEARQEDRLVVLSRRRPSVGLTMGAGLKEGTVVVERIEPGGPADKAGIRVGDQIVEAEGRKIRSAYQAVDVILARQPGDRLKFLVEQDNRRETREVTLSGNGDVSPKAEESAGTVVGPQVNVRMVRPDQLEVRGGSGVKELGRGQTQREYYARSDELGVMRTQIANRDRTIARLQAELDRLEQLQLDTDEAVVALKKEIAVLREQLRQQEKVEPKP